MLIHSIIMMLALALQCATRCNAGLLWLEVALPLLVEAVEQGVDRVLLVRQRRLVGGGRSGRRRIEAHTRPQRQQHLKFKVLSTSQYLY